MAEKGPIGLVAAVALVGAGCGATTDTSGWAGTVIDSAGITIVDNTGSGAWRSADRPTVEQEVVVGAADGDAAYEFGNIAGIDVNDDSTVYVLDQQGATVRVFNATGEFVRAMGRPGSGPGELSTQASGVLVGPGDTVFVPDIAQQRMVRFTQTGDDAGTFPIPFDQGFAIRWEMTPASLFVQQSRPIEGPGQSEPQNDYLLVRDRDGVLLDTLLTLPAGQSFQIQASGMPRMRLFEPEPVWALLSDGRTVFGVNSEFNLRVYDGDGNLERIIRRPFQQSPVTEADRESVMRLMREAMNEQGAPPQVAEQFLSTIEFADVYPAFAFVRGGPDGSIWVQRIQTAQDVAAAGGEFDARDIGGPVWDVFDAEGRYLGPLELPARFTPFKVLGNRIWGVWRDDLDVQHVRRLRVDGNWSWTFEG